MLPVDQGLRLVPTGPGDSRDLHLGLGVVTHASWMAEGDRLLVAAEEADGRLRLHVVDNALQPAPSPPRPVSAPFSRDPLPSFGFRVSPDGRRAAITDREGRILVVPLDGSEPYPLPGAGIDETPVQWSPDGRSLYCYGPRSSPPGIYRIDIASGDRALWREIRSPSPASLGVFPLLSRNLKAGAYGSLDSSADLFLVTGLR